MCVVIEIGIDDIKRWEETYYYHYFVGFFSQMILKALEEKWYKAQELQPLKF